MTSEDVKSELQKDPFVPIRLHLVSGQTIDIGGPGKAWMLQNAVMVMEDIRCAPERQGRYDIVALRNIERIEQLSD